jgi:hypothetical protein
LWRDDRTASVKLNSTSRTADNPPPCPD